VETSALRILQNQRVTLGDVCQVVGNPVRYLVIVIEYLSICGFCSYLKKQKRGIGHRYIKNKKRGIRFVNHDIDVMFTIEVVSLLERLGDHASLVLDASDSPPLFKEREKKMPLIKSWTSLGSRIFKCKSLNLRVGSFRDEYSFICLYSDLLVRLVRSKVK
jgi:hypothetical protein